MPRWILSLVLTIGVALDDPANLFAQMCRAAPHAVDSTLSAYTEDEDGLVNDPPVRQILIEPNEECDTDDLNYQPNATSSIDFFHFPIRSSFHRIVRFAMITRISTHLRI
jgi:hypothetical protein